MLLIYYIIISLNVMGFMDIVFLLSLKKELFYKRNIQVRGR